MTFTSNFFITMIVPLIVLVTVFSRGNTRINNVFIFELSFLFLLINGIGNIRLVLFICVFDYLFIKCSNRRKDLFVLAVVINLIPLLFFKYTGFIINNINMLTGLHINISQSTVPLGISFYTFESISILSDYYNGRLDNNIKLIDICFYLMFFVTVTSGPIIRFNDLLLQKYNRNISPENINKGLERFIRGLGKKILLANNLALFADNVFSMYGSGGSFMIAELWLSSIAYMLQLYLDFSGYSDMAIGLGQISGFKILENFNYPYTAKTLQSFWRRWHITLSQWFRDYVYIPLGGNRVSVPRHILNLFVVWCLTGLWHGANWTFIVWGGMNFILLVFEKYCNKVTKKLESSFIGHIYTLFFVNMCWIIFRSSSLSCAVSFIMGMFGFSKVYAIFDISVLKIIPLIIVSCIFCLPIKNVFTISADNKMYTIVKTAVLCIILLLSMLSISNTSYTPFIYGQF